MQQKICSKCKINKNLSDFHKSKNRKFGVAEVCKKCRSEISKIKNELNYRKIDIIDGEIWKDVVGYEGLYMISSIGRVMSLEKSWSSFKIRRRILKGFYTKHGYRIVDLQNPPKQKTVHRLVAEAFLLNKHNKTQVNHKNGIKSDNRVENLEWCTPSDNINHAISMGLFKIGEKSTSAKLTNEQVYFIRNSLDFASVLAKKFFVSKSTIHHIRSGRNWKRL